MSMLCGGPGGCGHEAFWWSVVDGGEVADAAVDVGVGGFEGGVGVDADGVGDRPVQPGQTGVQLFVGVVADGDDQVSGVQLAVDGDRPVGAELESVPVGGGDRAGVDAGSGMGAGGRRGDAA